MACTTSALARPAFLSLSWRSTGEYADGGMASEPGSGFVKGAQATKAEMEAASVTSRGENGWVLTSMFIFGFVSSVEHIHPALLTQGGMVELHTMVFDRHDPVKTVALANGQRQAIDLCNFALPLHQDG